MANSLENGMKKEQKRAEKDKKYLILTFLAISIIVYLYFAVQTRNIPYFDKIGESNNLNEQKIGNLKAMYKTPEGDVFLDSVDSYLFYFKAKQLDKGNLSNQELLPVLELASYKIAKTFNSDATLLSAVFYLPLFFGIVSIILIFFITKKFANIYSAFFTSFFFAITPSLMNIFKAGFGDTNPLNIMLSFVFVFFLFNAIEFKEMRRTIIYSALAALTLFVFWFAWDGWYYMLFVTAVFLWIWAIIFFADKKKIKLASAVAAMPLAIAGILFLIFREKIIPATLRNYIFQPQVIGDYPTRFGKIKELFGPTPQLFLWVAGGWIVLAIAVFALVFIIYKTRAFTKEKSGYFLFVIVWLALMTVAYLSAVRFASFFVVPFCILVGVGLSAILTSISRIKIFNKKYAAAVILILFAAGLFFIILPKTTEILLKLPEMEKSVYQTAMNLKQVSSEDALIVSWWDEGNFYNAFADREVYLKSGPNPRKTYMLEKALTSNETEAVKILEDEICSNRSECYVVLSSWLVRYASDMFKDASWDFEKMNYTDFRSVFISFNKCSVDVNKGVVSCGNYSFDINNNIAYDKKGNKVSFVVANETTVLQENFGSEYVFVMYNEGKSIFSTWVRKDKINSLIVRMFFLNGYGLKHFEKVSEYTGLFKKTVAFKFISKKSMNETSQI